MNNILIIDIGNEYLNDDAVGLHIADKLSGEKINCSIRKCAGEGISLINLWEDFDNVILVDAVKSEKEAGHIYKVNLNEKSLDSDWFRASSHLFSVPEAINLARTVDKLPDKLIIYGIEGKSFDYGTDISPEISKSIDKVVASIKKDISGH